MKKVTDRFWLGVLSGLGGNAAKIAVEEVANRLGISSSKGYTTAAGIFLKKPDVKSPLGKAVGIIADNMVAMGLGVTCIYWATLMGKDKSFIKGAGLGAAEWGVLYGVASRLGATSIFPVKPNDALATFISHMVFGIVKMAIAVNLGDKRLFKPGNLTLEIEEPEKFKFKYLSI
ncbi:hypothetical protein [Desulfosporosinus meridiei]|uniref:Uncharacterized protein n=1 Tax=Desulfosporosinus meridiei (strain ATCC BAA-275 / DSM 13257 / KCTC 12902 / NCIMB 13706 / S10) TaxID=768704 RepID=J7IK38_DESMD|nr:hypothetical protein [Desulfosporosinus meridiei]AFQ42122.1 hypothetical protein Desmer_0016 [Desulfosporosinus meridiei DSM 13257]